MIGYFKKHIYGRLALLFGLAAAILVSLTYYVLFYWAVFDKDNILDVHDAYFHYKFVDSWGSSLDTVAIGQELESLQLMGIISRHFILLGLYIYIMANSMRHVPL